MEVLNTYTKFLILYPYRTKMITAGYLFAISDLVVQKYIEQKREIDLKRLVKVTSVGGLFLGPVLHKWFGTVLPLWYKNVLQKFVPGIFKKSTPFKEAAGMLILDQTVGAVAVNWSIITLFGILEHWEIQKSIQNSNNCLGSVLVTNWIIWPATNMINFFFMPIHFRVLFANIIGFFWNIFINWISHKKKDSKQ